MSAEKPRGCRVDGMRLVDVRASRFEQAIVVVILLAGFVFRASWSIPTAAAVALVGVAFGDQSPVVRLWNQAIAPHRPAATDFEPAPVARTQILLIAGALLIATLVLLAGSIALASIVAAVVAIVALLGATGVVNAAAELRRRAQRD